MTSLEPELADELRRVLQTACGYSGLDASDASLIKYTNNATYRLGAGVIARIGIGLLGRERAPRVVATARWLAAHDAPTVRLLDLAQPIFVGDHAVTFWHEVTGGTDESDFSADDLAGPLRTLHQLSPSDAAGLPMWSPFAAAARRMAVADPTLATDDLAWLRQSWNAVQADSSQLRTVRKGFVHGDAHTGNLLRQSDGTTVLADLDSSGIGPIAWDLSVVAVDGLRFGRATFQDQFVRAYGDDVTKRVEWPLLRRIRELQLVTSAIPDLAHRPEIATEHAYRLATLRDQQVDAIWHPYR